jgi:hypothetical protein
LDAAAGARYRRATMVDVNAYAGLLEAIETRFESEAALDELERHVNTDGRLTADDREHLRRRIWFYRGDFHGRRRELERRDRGELDVLPLER